jgi:hypothetical protein
MTSSKVATVVPWLVCQDTVNVKLLWRRVVNYKSV